jgi:hypothetical protein
MAAISPAALTAEYLLRLDNPLFFVTDWSAGSRVRHKHTHAGTGFKELALPIVGPQSEGQLRMNPILPCPGRDCRAEYETAEIVRQVNFALARGKSTVKIRPARTG